MGSSRSTLVTSAAIMCVVYPGGLGQLPDPYLGGLLMANTINSRAPLGGVSDPPGYTQPSIATVRLWKRRE